MRINDILKQVKHRPWDLPKHSWKFYQEWNQAIFLHWEVDLDELRKIVPTEMEIDLYEGKPWVSLVAFTMEKIRPRFLPYFPPISNFDEINIRTYVKFQNKAGVYFLSIEGGKKISCQVAKSISELPYRFSNIARKDTKYLSHNFQYGDQLEIEFIEREKVEKKMNLDLWLTERYALFQDAKNSINEFDIHHLEWEIQNLEVKNLIVNYARFKKLINKSPDKISYSKGVKVLAWGKKKHKI